ncbi:leucine-rich repeat-containing protein 75B isoform X2 [Pseudophryne corroboree]|uniref:leucine-rich repeat-containing protein 75B isoform X2 n=1 Tax=Pseudophryne corroboree TaxID=495146 RepID=UPI0030815C12
MGGRVSRQSSLEDEPEDAVDSWPLKGETAGSRGDFAITSLILNSERIPGVLRRNKPAPYVRRAAWIRDIQALLRDHKQDRALHVLKLLRKEHDQMKSTDRICRQLLYHLTPHSKWHRHSLPQRKSMTCLKNSLQEKSNIEALDLSGIPLSPRDIHRVVLYLQEHGDSLTSVDLSFTELTDSTLGLALPALAALPNLTHLALNGNRLSFATLKEFSEAMKDNTNFPSLAWVDLGNNVDICSMPQPMLLGLRRRLCQQNLLPTIPEAQDSDLSEGGVSMSFPLPWDS